MTICCFLFFVCSSAMRNLLTKAGLFGSVSVAFGTIWWSQQKTESNPITSSAAPNPNDACPASLYELQLVQVLFRHGARTPLKSIPDVMEVTLCWFLWTLLVIQLHLVIYVFMSEFKGSVGPIAPRGPTIHTHQLRGDGS